MKKFITFTLCLLLCVVTLGLTACGKSKKETVDISIDSVGNSGMVVTRGGYTYFVNGYKPYSTLENNKEASFSVGGLYRAKLNAEGSFDFDENGSIVGAEQISSKLAGFESTSLYVFGNKIYFATPITEVDKNGELQIEKLEFRRVSLTGGKTERFYTSKIDASKVTFEFYYAEGTVFLMINEDGTLKCINCFDKSVNQVATGVESLVLPKDTDNVFTSDSYQKIFYTTKNEDSKIVINNYNIITNKVEYRKITDYKTCELIDYKFGQLYYKAGVDDALDYTYLYTIHATKNAITSLQAYKLTDNEDCIEICFLENETDGYIVNTSDKSYYLDAQGGSLYPFEEKLEIIAVRGGYIYLNEDSTIKRINVYNLKVSKDMTKQEVLTVDGLQTYNYDIDEQNLYVYATKGTNTYLYSIKISNVMDDEEFEKKLLGVYDSADIA